MYPHAGPKYVTNNVALFIYADGERRAKDVSIMDGKFKKWNGDTAIREMKEV